jgi:hypothetical protein
MHHRTRLAILIAGTITTSLGGVLVACSTDNGNTQPLPGFDSGRPKDGSSGTSGTSGGTSGGTSSGEGPVDAGEDCSSPKTPKSNAGVFCFKDALNADSKNYCTVGEKKICCADAKDDGGAFIKGECVAATDNGAGGYEEGHCSYPPDKGGREWHCTEKSHCPTGSACCVTAGTGGDPLAQNDSCGTFKNSSDIKFVGGTRCKASCAATELTLCAKDDDCSGGKTCKFFNLASRFSGVCK